MRYALKDYQDDAVRRVLRHLSRAREDTHRHGDLVAFALSATTGSGKTVMATAVIEALFKGSEDFEVEPDPGAVVLWVTDDPALNEQTRHRFIEAGDRLEVGQLQIIDEGFQQETFTPGNVYFLNIQKLRADTTYVKRSDQRAFTLWDTIRNTIVSDDHTLFLVLDEAHKGMRSSSARTTEERNRATTVQRLINGHNGIPPVPIVWGISATVDRFTTAMQTAHAEGRITYPATQVDPKAVQESGLLKDIIWLDFPDESGVYDTTFLRRALREMRELTDLWAAYTEREGMTEPVLPLMVLQVSSKPSNADLLRHMDVIREEWPDLPDDAVANVFGEHTGLQLGLHTVPYISPQDVQEASHIRVLLAKDAVSTGWDCPRAEVLFSLRPASDRTHITQLLGRMVRTPLARRIESDERLNAVSCFLPYFDRSTATDVALVLTGEKEDEGSPDGGWGTNTGRKVLTSPIALEWNPQVPEDVRMFLEQLPSEAAPRGAVKPIKRLLGLAAALAVDDLMEKPNEKAHQVLYDVLNGQMAQRQYDVDAGVEEVRTADIRRITTRVAEGALTESTSQERADARTVDDAFRKASTALGAAIANGYVKRLALAADEDEFDVSEARARVAALLAIAGVRETVDKAAEDTAREWLNQLRVDIKGLNEERRAVYADLQLQDREPQPVGITIQIPRTENSRDGDNNPLPTQIKHVQSDANGRFPIGALNDWERQVVDAELHRLSCVGWYRNPSKATPDALQIPYEIGNGWKPMQPDFIFFSRKQDGTLGASIVDPHGVHLADALPKLKGLARFAERYGNQFLRIEAISKVGEKLQVLDLMKPNVREAVRTASSAAELYRGEIAERYS